MSTSSEPFTSDHHYDDSDSSTSGILTNFTEDVTQANEANDRRGMLALWGCEMSLGIIFGLVVLSMSLRARRRLSHVDQLMTHIVLANICILSTIVPTRIGFNLNNESQSESSESLLSKILLLIGDFGFCLTSNLLVCITVDRFLVVVCNMKLSVAQLQSRRMQYCAWAIAVLCAGIPRVIDFHVAYLVFRLITVYLIPSIVIVVCGVFIYYKKRQIDNEPAEAVCVHEHEADIAYLRHFLRMRRTNYVLLELARRRTLKMVTAVNASFIACWFPYAVMTIWSAISPASASHVSPTIQELLFALAILNNCLNPLLYGFFSHHVRATLRQVLANICCVTKPDNFNWQERDAINDTGISLAMTSTQSDPNLSRVGVRFEETSLSVSERLDQVSTSQPKPYRTRTSTPPPHVRNRILHGFHHVLDNYQP